MVKAMCNLGHTELSVAGTGFIIMSELCCIVDTVCERYTKDEEEADSLKRIMIKQIAHVLLNKAEADEKDNK